jgi:hypothetical protein
MTLLVPPGATYAVNPNVEVYDLRVNGQGTPDFGLGDSSPILSWKMQATPSSRSHRCHRSGSEVACPADAQTAYQIQVAEGTGSFSGSNLLWDSGKVVSDKQTGISYAGEALESRQQITWRVRVWDADGEPSDWSDPAQWEMGMLEQTDWGDARWIEYPGRNENQPLPIFARSFDVDGNVSKARLFLSGIGVQLPTVNGHELTDEVLAPGYSNWQLASEYRTYDVTDELVSGSNTVGVQLGNGTAYVRRSATGREVEVPQFGDFTLELDVTVLNQAAGVFFRADASGNAYMWQLNNTQNNPRFRPHLRVNGGYTLLDEIPLEGIIDNDLSEPNTLTITAEGDQITTFINGIEVDSRTDNSHTSGTIGFRTAGQESGLFDNITITESDDVTFSEDFSGTNPFSAAPRAAASAAWAPRPRNGRAAA